MRGPARRDVLAALAWFGGLALLPAVAGDYVLTVMILVLQFAFLGQAWNLMLGFAGQLSLGHALYLGLGGYAAAVSVVKFGLSPWLGMAAGVVLCMLAGAVIGFLGFRFAVRGIYFALLTIALAEFVRVLFGHWRFVGATGGLFLPAPAAGADPLLTLRGGARFFYYVLLALTAASFAATAALLHSRPGYLWRAIRDDEDAARALGVRAFPLKVLAAAISGGLTGIGGALFAMVNGSLFPDTVFGIGMSIEIILGTVIGGVGTLFGPMLGTLVIIPLGELANYVGEGVGGFGVNKLAYGVLVLLMVLFMPEGLWPWLAPRLGFASSGPGPPAAAAAAPPAAPAA